MDVKERGFEGMKWIHLTQGQAAVNTIMSLRVP